MGKTALSWAILAVLAASLAVLFSYWLPGQPASLIVYSGLAVAAAGLACVVIPLRFLGIRKRSTGARVFLAGVVVVFAALFWPARLTQVPQPQQSLDAVLPQYHFNERHVVRVHAAPEQVMAALRETTFGDIPSFVTLMRLRNLGSGQASRRSPGISQVKILEVFSNPRSGFLPIVAEPFEVVYGMAGQPWSNRRGAVPSNPAEYAAFHEPGSVKIAFNLRVRDLGSGWSELSTETRILAFDDAGRRKMGMYWRVIEPGSGMIRRQWVNSIRKRAERAAGRELPA